MSQFRFDGRTAIVTGAGGNPGMGRAHALLLARLGANVVVNDVGAAAQQPGFEEPASAEAVAREIRELGGNAVADFNSVATLEGATAMVGTALDAFGGLDILVNNAAISITVPFDVLSPTDFERHIEVNLLGTAWTCRAAWPHMKAAGYGRIVNIASAALNGAVGATAYGASKGGVLSLTRSLAAEGAAIGVKANAVNPGAFTRLVMATQREGSTMYNIAKDLPPELTSPVVAYLAHEACPVSGECFDTYGGTVQRTYLAQTRGFSDQNLTIDLVAEHWQEVMDETDAVVLPIGGTELADGARPYDGD
jgi:NAD(P)-dependent dehydrogenase (short-subunit alcohol dehydrogenase family)